MYSVILCGGSGTRLWPLSRKNYPKQFLNLFSNKSLLQETFLRMQKIMPQNHIFFVTNQANYFNVFNQIKELAKDFNQEQILIEPVSLNTAPAITLAVKYLTEKFKINTNDPILFLPSDHYIKSKEKYFELLNIATQEIGTFIGTIGITPQSPKTGYGYIKKGKSKNHYFKVIDFKEKPKKSVAQKYLASGNYVWNSGIYIFNAKTFFKELALCSPEISKLADKKLDKFIENFKKLPSISIDYAIAEKSKKVIVFEGNFGWNDIGSFDSLAEISKKNYPAKHLSLNSKNIYIHSDSKKLVATIGVEDLNIIETADSILVQKQGHGEEVKKIVTEIKKQKMKELEHNLIVHRPWGKYEILLDNPDHKVKKITVYPGEKLSLQSHNHRAEHWIVTKGSALIVNGDQEIALQKNESTFIPIFAKHRLSNPGKINLEIIEVQSGDYLEEDDIIRYEDIYNRDKI